MGDAFEFGGKTYTQSDCGLITDLTISEELAGETLDLSKLSSAKWENFIALNNRTLDLSNVTEDSIVYDDATAPTVKVASFTVNNKRITLNGEDTAETAIDSVKISANTVLSVDFKTQVNTPSGTVTVNSNRYNGSSDLIIDSDGNTSTLYRGTVILDTTNPTVTPTNDDVTLKVQSGSINSTVFDGLFVTVGDLDPTDSFTFDGKTYMQTAVGLMFEDGTISEKLAGTAIELSDLADVEWSNIIVPSNGTLDLTAATTNALVLDDATNPSVKFANFTISNDELKLEGTDDAAEGISTVKVAAGVVLTVDFTTQINSLSGFVTVNDKTFDGTTELTLDFDGNNVTLTSGTVSLDTGDDVTATGGNKITASDGDGLTVNVSDDTLTVNGLNVGDKFKVDNNTYEITTAGLINTKGRLWTSKESYSDGITLDALNNSANWSAVIEVKDDVLNIDSSTLSNGEHAIIVDDASKPTEVLATLTKEDDEYTLTKTDGTLSGINLDGIKITIDKEYADVPITTTNEDGKQSEFTVTPTNKASFTVDATGNAPIFEDVKTIEISSGKIELTEGQRFTLAEGAEDVAILTGNGTYDIGDETFEIAGLDDDSKVEFTIDDDGNTTEVIGFEKDSTVTIDGTTYTAPRDAAILHYNDEDGWYFDGFVYDEYIVTVDANGDITVNAGAKFTDVLSSGKKLDGSIKFAADISKTPVTVINKGNTPFDVIDADGNTLANNLSRNEGTIFSADGVEVSSLADVAGTSFILQESQYVKSDGVMINAEIKDCEVGIGSKGKSISVDNSATITLPEDISISLNASDYTINGVEFTASGTATAVTTSDGFEVDLAKSDALTYDDMTFATNGTATINSSGDVTLSGGVVVTNTEGETFTVKGKAILDDKTINATSAAKLTANDDGVKVGNATLVVDGDTDGYKISITNNKVVGLENIGNSDGVTVNGLTNATVKTDKSGSFTAGNKSFDVDGNVTYTIKNGNIVSIDEAMGTISGDFSDGLSVNGDNIKITGAAYDVVTDGTSVTKVLTSDEDTFTINGKTYDIIDDESVAFNISNGKVSGIESLEGGTLIISNKETGFNVNDTTIDLTGNSSPVTLNIVDSNIVSVNGVDGTINGLENAIVYGLTSAVVNEKLLDITDDSEFDAIVKDGTTSTIEGVTSDATINSAPSMTVTTTENGTFTFVTDKFIINDTLDASVDFLTDENSRVVGIDNFAGSISGSALDGLILNGNKLKLSGDNLVVETDGEKITNISGLEDGNDIEADLDGTNLVIPEGEVTINGTSYKLEGDEDGVTLSNGESITGLDKDATLTFGGDGEYTIDGKPFTVEAGDALTVNRDGVYKINPDSPPITEKTEVEDILSRSENSIYVDEEESVAQNIDLASEEGDDHLVLIDSKKNAPDTVKSGAGNDSIVVRHGAEVEVDLNEDGNTLLVPTAGKVTLEGYNGDNASVQTYEYNDIPGAIKSNDIMFGDGSMTLGDATVIFDSDADSTGAVTTTLINATGDKQAVGFTNTAGGEIDKSDATEDYIVKGNYAENTGDTQKSGGSTIKTGSGNDTILAGASDYVDAGSGKNQIYLTDKKLRNSGLEGATIVLNEDATDKTQNFNSGFDKSSDKILIQSIEDITFDYGSSRLVMSVGQGAMALNNVDANDTVYEIKFTDGTNDYNAAIAKNGNDIEVTNGTEANVFLGTPYSTGISFSEYTGAVEVNLNENSGSLDDNAVQFYGINRVTAGAGDTSLIGAANTSNTLTAGTGNGSIWSNSGDDLMQGNTSSRKGSTSFFFLANDGSDTIENFDFMDSTNDTRSDKVMLNGVTNVTLDGDDVVININNSPRDYLTIVDAKGKTFKVNDDLIAKVDENVAFDGFTNCYVGVGSNATLTVGKGMGNVELWLGDTSIENHGTMFYGDFKELNAALADGYNTLAGNGSENLIIGGTGINSIWGGAGMVNDTLVGGAGHNEFFFCAENGHDVITNAHSGDVVNMYELSLEQIARADISNSGVTVELTDGSTLDVQSSANIEYKLADGSAWTADHTNKVWNKK